MAGQIEMFKICKFEDLFGPAPIRNRVKRLKELFVIHSDKDGNDWQLQLDFPLRERYQFLTQNRYRLSADLSAAESLAGALMEIVKTPDLIYPISFFDHLPQEARPSLPKIYELCRDVRGALTAYLQEADSNGRINNRNSLSRLARVFSHVCGIYGGAEASREPHGKAWTCNFRDLETGNERRVPIAVAAIEGAFILTRGVWKLPKKKQLWEWMESHVLEGRKVSDQMKAEILESAMLTSLDEARSW